MKKERFLVQFETGQIVYRCHFGDISDRHFDTLLEVFFRWMISE